MGTQVTERQIVNRQLTGASFRPEMNIFDETFGYSLNDEVHWQGDLYKCVTNTTALPEGDLTNSPDASSNWTKVQSSVFNASPSSVQTYNNIPVTISFDTERINTGFITLTNSEFVFQKAGTFIVHLEMSIGDAQNTRTLAKSYLQIDQGAGFVTIPNSEVWTYNRTTGGVGLSTGALTIPITVQINDKIRVQSSSNISSNVTTVINGCNFTVFSTSGTSGAPGPQDPVGPAGDFLWKGTYNSGISYVINDVVEYQGSSYVSINPSTGSTPPSADWDLVAQKGTDGSGSSIDVKDEGTSIGQFSSLNFVGSTIQASVNGTVADVTILPKKQYQVCIWAEENASLGNNTYEWAFGNGANTGVNGGISIFVPAGFSAQVVGLSATLPAGSATIQLEINGINTGQTIFVDTNTSYSDAGTITPQTVTNGDRINFKTQSAAGTARSNTVACWIEFTEI